MKGILELKRNNRKNLILWGLVCFCLVFQMKAYAFVDVSGGPGTVESQASSAQTPENQMTAEQKEALGPGYTTDQGPSTATVTGGSGIRQLDPNKPMLAFTYDDGPCTGPGNRIMDVFLQYGQRCTFFVVGNRISSRAEEMKRMADNGFEIGNHSWSHQYYNKLSAEQIRKDVEKCNEAIRTYAGVTPALARTPGGIKSSSILAAVNMPVILWNIDTLDWKTRNTQKNVNAVLGKVKDGDIILMHELYNATAEATEILVPKLVEQGFQLVTVSELIYYKGKSVTAGSYYFSF